MAARHRPDHVFRSFGADDEGHYGDDVYGGSPGMSAAQVRELYSEFYKDSYFVRIRPEGEFPATKEVYGSNFCDISVTVDERTNRATIVSVIDNLMKGAAGQAVQNLNIMNGWQEETGLTMTPVYP